MKFELDRWDLLVLEYRKEISDRKKDKIFKELCGYYYPKFHSIKLTFPKKYWDDMEQIYMINILKSIEQWKGINSSGNPCHWSTYAYIWATTKVKSEIYEKYILKDKREIPINFIEMYSDEEDSSN